MKGGRLQTTVPVVPDAPDRPLPPRPPGWQTGLSGQYQEPLQGRLDGRVDYTGQNGKARSERVKVKTSCGKKSKRTKGQRRN